MVGDKVGCTRKIEGFVGKTDSEPNFSLLSLARVQWM